MEYIVNATDKSKFQQEQKISNEYMQIDLNFIADLKRTLSSSISIENKRLEFKTITLQKLNTLRLLNSGMKFNNTYIEITSNTVTVYSDKRYSMSKIVTLGDRQINTIGFNEVDLTNIDFSNCRTLPKPCLSCNKLVIKDKDLSNLNLFIKTHDSEYRKDDRLIELSNLKISNNLNLEHLIDENCNKVILNNIQGASDKNITDIIFNVVIGEVNISNMNVNGNIISYSVINTLNIDKIDKQTIIYGTPIRHLNAQEYNGMPIYNAFRAYSPIDMHIDKLNLNYLDMMQSTQTPHIANLIIDNAEFNNKTLNHLLWKNCIVNALDIHTCSIETDIAHDMFKECTVNNLIITRQQEQILGNLNKINVIVKEK